MGKRTPITPERFRKVLTALQDIEKAQNLLYGAAQNLCSVPGFGAYWTRVCKQGDSTKALWHRLNDHHAATPLVKSGGGV